MDLEPREGSKDLGGMTEKPIISYRVEILPVEPGIFRYRYFTVFLWGSRAEAHKATGVDCLDWYAFCIIDDEDEEFAQLHFIEGCWFNGETVAHEIQHFILEWIVAQEWDIIADKEKICSLAGSVTNRFWLGYKKASEEDQSPPKG